VYFFGLPDELPTNASARAVPEEVKQPMLLMAVEVVDRVMQASF